MKTCTKCVIEKEDNCFDKTHNQCKDCRNAAVKAWKTENQDKNKESNKQYRIENQEKIQKFQKQWYQDNKEEILEDRKFYYAVNAEYKIEYVKQWKSDNPDYDIEYRKQNKIKLNDKKRQYEANRKKNDPTYRLRTNISKFINILLKKNGSSKNGKSILEFLPYSILELRKHLEKQFESWMTWENYGVYNKDIWIDADVSTWTWQLDHIIPSSKFYYTSMSDENFQKCWALSNLRPLSSKQNVLDGARRNGGFHV